MSALGGFAFAGVALTGWIGLGLWMGRRNDKRLAASRPGMTALEAIQTIAATGADEDVAQAVIDWIGAYYGPEATPHPSDRMRSDVAIDPKDMEDFVERFFENNGLPMPTTANPETLPDHDTVTLTSFALYLTQRRATLLGEAAARA